MKKKKTAAPSAPAVITAPGGITQSIVRNPDGSVTVSWVGGILCQVEQSPDMTTWKEVEIPTLAKQITIPATEAQAFFRIREINPATILRVEVGGDDTIAQRGNWNRPFSNLEAAFDAMLPGDAMVIGAGMFGLFNRVRIPDAGMVIGNTATTINNHYTTTIGPVITLSSKCLVANASIASVKMDRYQAAIGLHMADGHPLFEDARTWKLNVTGETDCLYIRTPGACSLTDYGSIFYSHWDALTLFVGTSKFTGYGSKFIVDGKSMADAALSVRNNAVQLNGGSVFKLYRGLLRATGHPDQNNAIQLSGINRPSCELWNCRVEADTPGFHATRPDGSDGFMPGNGTLVCHQCQIDQNRVNFAATYD